MAWDIFACQAQVSGCLNLLPVHRLKRQRNTRIYTILQVRNIVENITQYQHKLQKQVTRTDEYRLRLLDYQQHPSGFLDLGRANRRSSIKGKIYLRRDHESQEGQQMYFSSISFTSALDGCWWSTPSTDNYTPRNETQYLSYRKLGRPQGRSAQVRKSRPYRNSIPGPSNPYKVAPPTELSRPTHSQA